MAFVGLFASTLQYGNGVHQWDVPLSNVYEFGKVSIANNVKSFCVWLTACLSIQLANITEIIYCPVIFATKLAILLQIQHIFVTGRNIRFYLLQLVIWVNGIWYFINVFLIAFMCTPRAKIWDDMVPGHCFIDFYTVNLTSAIFNPVSDILILILPIFWACKLQMVWKRKVGVVLIFATGIMLVSH